MGGVRAAIFDAREYYDVRCTRFPSFGTSKGTMGHPSGYRAQGYLFVATEDRHLEYLRANFERQVAAGLTTASLISHDDIVGMVPQAAGGRRDRRQFLFPPMALSIPIA